MDFLSVFSTIPAVAGILLIVVLGIIVLEVFILLRRHKKPATPVTPIEDFATSSQPAQTGQTPITVKSGSRRKWLAFAAIALLLAAIPVTFFLTQQNQELRSRAGNGCGDKPDGYWGACGGSSGDKTCNYNQNIRCLDGKWECIDNPGFCLAPGATPAPPVYEPGCNNPNNCDGYNTNTVRCSGGRKLRCDRVNCAGWWTDIGSCSVDGDPTDPNAPPYNGSGSGSTGGGTTGGTGTGTIGDPCTSDSQCGKSGNVQLNCLSCSKINSRGKVCGYDSNNNNNNSCGSQTCTEAACQSPGSSPTNYPAACEGLPLYGIRCLNDGTTKGQKCMQNVYSAPYNGGPGLVTVNADACGAIHGGNNNSGFVGCGDKFPNAVEGGGQQCNNCYKYSADGLIHCFREGTSCGANAICFQQPASPQCGSACTVGGAACPGGMTCNNGVCRNPSCTNKTNCICDTTYSYPTPPQPSSTPYPTPTHPTTSGPQCRIIKVYRVTGDETNRNNWQQLTATQLTTLKAGDTVRIAVVGDPASGIDKARFRINTAQPVEVTSKNPMQEYVITYTIPANTIDFTFSAEVHDRATGRWL